MAALNGAGIRFSADSDHAHHKNCLAAQNILSPMADAD